MEKWTYEVPPVGAGASGLEDYQVETRDGEIVGKIISVLDHEGDRYLAFDTGLPPLVQERRAVRWQDIEAIDHDALTVRIGLAKPELGDALELDPANQVEDGEADAVRLTDLPNDVTAVDSSATGDTSDAWTLSASAPVSSEVSTKVGSSYTATVAACTIAGATAATARTTARSKTVLMH